MRRAIELAHLCPPAAAAYSVGAVIVDDDGKEIAWGYSRESDPRVHAEESALAKVPADDPRLGTATLYSTLEPCSHRASRPSPCAQLILDAGIPRVVFAWREPSLFVEECIGARMLAEHGADVTELTELAEAAMEPNRHLAL
jgi:diaminohydroxyphosphoribosylaminopyrimidine deaminase/5-amino-6-(5-phosphoribosylamino)uracil reductase